MFLPITVNGRDRTISRERGRHDSMPPLQTKPVQTVLFCLHARRSTGGLAESCSCFSFHVNWKFKITRLVYVCVSWLLLVTSRSLLAVESADLHTRGFLWSEWHISTQAVQCLISYRSRVTCSAAWIGTFVLWVSNNTPSVLSYRSDRGNRTMFRSPRDLDEWLKNKLRSVRQALLTFNQDIFISTILFLIHKK